MRILGVDPGTRRCGYGVVETAGPGRLVYVECGVIEPPARAPLAERLAELYDGMREVVAELAPTVVAVEDVFHGVDARAALVLGHARGVVLAAAGVDGLVVHAYPPATVKKSVTGSGAAAKEQVGGVVKALLRLQRAPRTDAADALAVAVCHAHHAPLLARRQAATQAALRVRAPSTAAHASSTAGAKRSSTRTGRAAMTTATTTAAVAAMALRAASAPRRPR